MSFVNQIYPNEEVIWGALIAIYPFITGLVAGSFIVSSLAYVFGKDQYKRVSSIALLASFSLLLTASLPLIADLRQPQRAIEIFTRPHLISTFETPNISPMAIFGFLLVAYIILTALEILYLFRADMSLKASSLKHLGWLYSILALGLKQPNEEILKRDREIVKWLGLIGIPLAVIFHFYVGFLFSSMKQTLWSNPLIGVNFLVSAIVSGTAFMIVLYYLYMRFSNEKVNLDIIKGLATLLIWSILIDLGLQFISPVYLSYHKPIGYEVVEFVEYNVLGGWKLLEYLLTGIIPAILLLIPALRKNVPIVLFSSILTLIGVFAYRWITVIGAQLLSRTNYGILSYTITYDEIYNIIGIFSFFLFILFLLSWIFPWNGKYATGGVE